MLSSSSLLAWSLALPAVLGVFIETNVLNTTSLICATRYASTSLEGAIPTVTFEGYLNHGPVMFHTTTTPVETVTPKPVITKTTRLVTNTTWITTTPISGVWNSTSTVLATSTSWHHVYSTETEIVRVTGTSRTTAWIPATTGFKPIKDTQSGWEVVDVEQPRIGHPHQVRDPNSASTVSTKCRRPLASKFPAAVECTEQVEFSTTEFVIATQRWSIRTTLPVVTYYNTTTVYAAITSTVLDVSATSTAVAEASSDVDLAVPATPKLFSRNPKYRDWFNFFGNHGDGAEETHSPAPAEDPANAPLPSIETPPLQPAVSEDKLGLVVSYPFGGEQNSPPSDSSSSSSSSSSLASISTSISPTNIITNTRIKTLTPFTVTTTWTGTSTTTSTHHIHATHTITALAACATQNMLYVNGKQKRINGIAPNIRGAQVEHAIPGVRNAYECCVACVAGDLECAFSLYELEGGEKGRCVLYVNERSGVVGQEVMGGDVVAEQGGERKCANQEGNMGVVSFRSRNGETAFVASNGYCGYLGDGDVVFP